MQRETPEHLCLGTCSRRVGLINHAHTMTFKTRPLRPLEEAAVTCCLHRLLRRHTPPSVCTASAALSGRSHSLVGVRRAGGCSRWSQREFQGVRTLHLTAQAWLSTGKRVHHRCPGEAGTGKACRPREPPGQGPHSLRPEFTHKTLGVPKATAQVPCISPRAEDPPV